MADRPMLFSGAMVRALVAGSKSQTRRILKPQPSYYQGAKEPPPGMSWVNKKRDAPYFAQHDDQLHWGWWDEYNREGPDKIKIRVAKGDRLWVRESWQTGMSGYGPQISYRATPDFFEIDAWDGPNEGIGSSFNYDRCPGARFSHWLGDVLSNNGPWRPSIHMPRWASRLTLNVTDVRVERLQDITKADALAEGVVEYFRGPDRLGWPAAAADDVVAAASELGIDGPIEMYRDLWNGINGAGSWDANPWVVAYSFTVHRHNIDRSGAAA